MRLRPAVRGGWVRVRRVGGGRGVLGAVRRWDEAVGAARGGNVNIINIINITVDDVDDDDDDVDDDGAGRLVVRAVRRRHGGAHVQRAPLPVHCMYVQ